MNNVISGSDTILDHITAHRRLVSTVGTAGIWKNLVAIAKSLCQRLLNIQIVEIFKITRLNIESV